MDTIKPLAAEHDALAESLASQGVEYVFASFIDVTGRAKSKCVPVEHLAPLTSVTPHGGSGASGR